MCIPDAETNPQARPVADRVDPVERTWDGIIEDREEFRLTEA